MSTKTKTKGIAVAGELPDELLLGYLTIFTVPDRPVPASKLTRTWAGNGLNMDLIPKVRQPVNTFEVACRSVETRRRTADKQVEVKVDRVMEDSDESVYQITHMVRDTVGQVIDHPKAMRVRFDKHTELIEVDKLEQAAYRALKGLEEAIREKYDELTDKVPGNKVRYAVRDYLKLMGATNVRRKAGGVYFVSKQHKPVLDGIAEALEKLYGGDADLHTIAYANGEGERDMLEKHYKLTAGSALDEQVRMDMVTNVIQERRLLGSQAKQMIAVLGEETDLVKEKMGILDEQIEKLMDMAA
jgi:hypothetical protein